VVLAHDHHEAKHAMDTNAVDGHRGSIPKALHDGVIVLDVKSIAISTKTCAGPSRPAASRMRMRLSVMLMMPARSAAPGKPSRWLTPT
jgi:hypothetical protein